MPARKKSAKKTANESWSDEIKAIMADDDELFRKEILKNDPIQLDESLGFLKTFKFDNK